MREYFRGRRGDRREARQDRREDRREWRRDRRDDRRDWREARREWRRDWRNDRRYNWRDYRYSHRGIFSPGYYYAPYRNHSYSRFSIGVILGSPFFADRYRIHDPWQSRLPAAYPGPPCVPYYDDSMLFDIYHS